MITFEEARQIVAEKRGALFSEAANFQVRETGWETTDRWIVRYISDAIDNMPWTSVDKETGEYFEDPGPSGFDPFPDKTPVG